MHWRKGQAIGDTSEHRCGHLAASSDLPQAGSTQNRKLGKGAVTAIYNN